LHLLVKSGRDLTHIGRHIIPLANLLYYRRDMHEYEVPFKYTYEFSPSALIIVKTVAFVGKEGW
jgi:hypothetical protein